jgi:excisionase family DNA binding protein
MKSEPHMSDLVATNGEAPATYTVAQAAHILGVSAWLYYDLAKKGQVPILRVGNRRLVPKIRLDAFLAGTWTPTS